MRKKLFLELFRKTLLVGFSFFCFGGGAIFAQIGGGGGIIHVAGDPDAILATQDVDINEGNICFDRDAQIVYFFDPTGTAGVNQWNGVAVGSFADTDTRLTNPTVSGGNLVFDILDVITNTTSGTETVAILDIAPVQSVTGINDISVTTPSPGVYQVDFTEFHTTLTITSDTLFYTDETNTVNSIVLPTSDGSDTQVEDAGDITVTGTGTTADPYVVDFSEALTTLTITNDTLFYLDEDGTTNNIVLPTSDGSDTQVEDAGDITVTGTGTTADPYIVDFSEALTTLTITNDTLFYLDEDGTTNNVVLPTSDGSDTQVEDAGDITVTGTGTTADPYVVDFTEFHTTLSITNDTLFYTDETNTVNSIVLPSSDGSDTQVEDAGDITVTGTGTIADPYVVDFSEALTTLTITNDTLFYLDEDGTTNSIVLPTSDGSDTQVEDAGDITVTGTGTTADPYVVDFSEALTTLTITNDTLYYLDEDGTTNNVVLPTSDGTDTQIDDSNSVYVLGDGSVATPYTLQVDGAHDVLNAGMVPVTDGAGNLSWTDAVTGAEITAEGAIQLNLTDGTSVILDLDDAPKVSDMSEVNTAITNLTTAGHPSGIVIADQANTFGLPATSQVGVIFFIKQ